MMETPSKEYNYILHVHRAFKITFHTCTCTVHVHVHLNQLQRIITILCILCMVHLKLCLNTCTCTLHGKVL